MFPLPDIFWDDIILPLEIGPRYFIGPTRKNKTTRRRRKQARISFLNWYNQKAREYKNRDPW